MKKRQKLLNRIKWFQDNPIVVIWRESKDRSYLNTVNIINRLWKVGPEGYPYERVASTLDEYLSLLKELTRSYFRYNRIRGEIITAKRIMSELGLTIIEAKYVYSVTDGKR